LLMLGAGVQEEVGAYDTLLMLGGGVPEEGGAAVPLALISANTVLPPSDHKH
jgi:hypothetical protein